MSTEASRITEERTELEAVLNSGIFGRAPNLASFLTYVCEKHFQGESDSVKEYSIAVEALRRPPDFDQRKDSIVRVEAHRLRKRLAEYYEAAGADHLVRIEIPNGQYSPRFVYNGARTSQPIEPQTVQIIEPPEPVVELPAVQPTPYRSWLTKGRLGIALLALLCIAFGAAYRLRSSVHQAPEVWRGSFTEPVASEFRFIPGYHGRPFTDRQGRVWQADAYFSGGVSVPVSDSLSIQGLPDPKFIRSRREGSFSYAIPERQGTYEVHFHFIVPPPGDASDSASNSTFVVRVNDKNVLDSFDPMTEAGGSDRFHSRVIRDVSPANDGKLHINFQAVSGVAFVSGIEVLSSEVGRIRPVRIVAAKSSVVDSDGLVWMANQYSTGGYLVERKDSVQDPRLRMLFVSEHFGNFTYRIPVPPGSYRIKLFFAETFFGSKLPYAGSATGARVFNVFANGVALLRDFDITKEAGGPNLALVKEFENIEPNAQGNIALEFIPLRNYAEVNAIEVYQTN